MTAPETARPAAALDQSQVAAFARGRSAALRGGDRHWLAIVVAIGLIVGAVNAIGYWTPTPWGDELSTRSAAERPLSELIGMVLTRVDAVHGLYYVLMHAVAAIGGTSMAVLRAPSVLAVGITAAGVAVLGARLGGRKLGVLAAAVFAIVPQVSWAATEARASALLMAAAVWLAIVLLHALRSGGRWWIGYGAFAAATICLNIYLVLMVAALAVAAVLLRPRSRRDLLPVIASSAVGIAVASPVVLLSVRQSGQVAWLTPFHAGTLRQVVQRQWFGDSVPFTVLAWSALVAVIVLVLQHRVVGPELRLVVVSACCTLLPTAVLIAVTIAVRPVYAPRYVIMSIPFVALLAAVPLARMRRPQIIAGVLVLTAAVTAPSFIAQRTTEAKGVPYSALEAALIADVDRDSAIWINAADLRDFRIYAQSTLRDHTDIALAEDHRTNGMLLDTVRKDADVAARAQRFDDVTVVADRIGWRGAGWLRALRRGGFDVVRVTPVDRVGVIDAVVVDLVHGR